MSHPSRLALDRLALGAGDDETKAHAATCPDCQVHLQKVQVELPVPAWVKETGERRRVFPAWVFGLATVAAVIAGLFWFQPNPWIAEKGWQPEVVVWLKHKDKVAPWSGETIHPGDTVQLEIAAGSFSELTVVDLSGPTPDVVLRQPVHGHVQAAGAFIFDAAPGPEKMTAIFSHAPLTDDEVRAALDGGSSVWTQSWTFPKDPSK